MNELPTNLISLEELERRGETSPNMIIHANCLDAMKYIPDGSVDMILCDLPYGVTECEWDEIIPFGILWENYKRVVKPFGVVVLFGAQPFTSLLVASNRDWFKQELILVKNGNRTGFMHAKNGHIKSHENIVVFSSGKIAHKGSVGRMTYNPQGLVYAPVRSRGTRKGGASDDHNLFRESHKKMYTREYTNYPTSVLSFPLKTAPIHPTQKPVELFSYLIRTYSNPGETVLDNCLGSGTTAVACIETGRNFIGIEQEMEYCVMSHTRVEAARLQPKLPLPPPEDRQWQEGLPIWEQ